MSTTGTETDTRGSPAWLELMRFLGIFAIYLGFMGEAAGRASPYVQLYHVPMLFFVLGGYEALYKEIMPFKKILVVKIKATVVPYFVYSLLSLGVHYLNQETDIAPILASLKQIFLGIRHQLFAPALWFPLCLFIINLLFWTLRRYVRNRWVILGITFLSFLVATQLLPNNPLENPSWVWNIDSALYYIFYHGIGFVAYETINKLMHSRDKRMQYILTFSWLLAGIYAFSIFFGRHYLVDATAQIPVLKDLAPVFNVLVITWFNLGLAKFFIGIRQFEAIGENTLRHCGNEFIVKSIFTQGTALLGLNLVIPTPMAALVFTFVLLLFSQHVLVPPEKWLLRTVERLLPNTDQ